jgi:hypothetical protein
LIKIQKGGIIFLKINPFGRRNGLQEFQREFELRFHPVGGYTPEGRPGTGRGLGKEPDPRIFRGN